MLKKQCQQFTIFNEFIRIDESMVLYRELHSARKFIKNKPTKFDYKVWMLCGLTGFSYNFAIYCSKKATGRPIKVICFRLFLWKVGGLVFFMKGGRFELIFIYNC